MKKKLSVSKSVYILSSDFGFRSVKPNHDWYQLSSLITGLVCSKFHDTGGHSDLSKGVFKHRL